MESFMHFTVVDIRGEYAYLRQENICTASEDLILAVALLPPEADVGSRIFYEAGEYTVVG